MINKIINRLKKQENTQQQPEVPRNKIELTLYGNLDEEKMEEVCNSLLYAKTLKEEFEVDTPVTFYISTWGGDALAMFGIYDLMGLLKSKNISLETFGFGKVMSAGVLLLASGEKGKRKIGRNTRIMMHSVRGSHHGSFHGLQTEMAETIKIQETHTKLLAAETNLTEKQLQEMFERKVDVYFDAEEAIKYGIADIIV